MSSHTVVGNADPLSWGTGGRPMWTEFPYSLQWNISVQREWNCHTPASVTAWSNHVMCTVCIYAVTLTTLWLHLNTLASIELPLRVQSYVLNKSTHLAEASVPCVQCFITSRQLCWLNHVRMFKHTHSHNFYASAAYTYVRTVCVYNSTPAQDCKDSITVLSCFTYCN